MRTILQTQASECGLACLAMIARHHGQHGDLGDLRRRFPVSLKGATLRQLMSQAGALGFLSRPLRLDLDELRNLKLPCILHWDLNHFVVLVKVTRRGAVVLDPAVGERRLAIDEVSRHFTGVALELTPNADFEAGAATRRLRLRQLTGPVSGLKRSLLQIVAVALALELFAIVAPLFNQMVIDDAITSHDSELLLILVLGFGLLLLVQTAIGFARSWMVTLLSQSLSVQWAGNLFAHLVRLPVEYFEKRHLGDVVSRFRSVDEIQRTLTTAAIEAVLDGVMAVVALALMMLYSAQLAGVVVAAAALYGLLRWSSYGPLRDAAAERLVAAAKENTHFLETLRAMAPLKLFGREDERSARWQNLLVEVQNRDVRTARLNIAVASARGLLFGLENLLVLWLGARLVMVAGTGGAPFTIGMLFAFIAYKGQFSGRVAALINHGVELKMLRLHGERLADIALHEPERDPLPDHDLAHLQPSLELKDVSFRYGEGEPWVLRQANLVVAAGESVAVTGASGAGKTTLLRVMLGLLEPSEGEVRYGGIPVRQLGRSNFRRCIGTVLQDDTLLTGSLADNIAFFDAQADPARVEVCARLAQVHDEIVRMPMGYQTLVGDLGIGLSGGQKQRILLARALYKQPRVLALDEATSHLDITNERAVTQALAQMHLTRIVIAHRPETIAGAQRVVQLHNGSIVETMRAIAEGKAPPGVAGAFAPA